RVCLAAVGAHLLRRLDGEGGDRAPGGRRPRRRGAGPPLGPHLGSQERGEVMLDSLYVLLDASLKGTALCLAAFAIAFILRQASAAARHLAWQLAFAGLLALPALSLLLPAWRVPLLPQRAAASPAAQTAEVSTLHIEDATHPSVQNVGAGLASARVGEDHSLVLPSKVTVSPQISLRVPLSWPAILMLFWSLGALATLSSLAAGMARVRRQRRGSQTLTAGPSRELADRLCADLAIVRPVALFRGGEQAMPMTWGFWRPAVLLPAGCDAWPAARRRSVLLHELAHVARRDWATQLACEAVCALHWWNPLVWAAARRLRIEGQQACGDPVLAAGASAADYAGDLLDIARSLRSARIAPLAAVAMARPSQLAGRLLAVLDSRRDRRGVPRRLAVPAWLAR